MVDSKVVSVVGILGDAPWGALLEALLCFVQRISWPVLLLMFSFLLLLLGL